MSSVWKVLVCAFVLQPIFNANSQIRNEVLDAESLREIRKDRPEAFCVNTKYLKGIEKNQRSRPLSTEQKIASIIYMDSSMEVFKEVFKEAASTNVKSVTRVIDRKDVQNKIFQSRSVVLSYTGSLSIIEMMSTTRKPMTCVQITPDPMNRTKNIKLDSRTLVVDQVTGKVCFIAEGQEIGRHGFIDLIVSGVDEAVKCFQEFDSMESEQLMKGHTEAGEKFPNQAK